VHSVSRGNTAAAAWVHEAWTAATGLPVNTVNAIIQSRTGYIWLTTYDGLVRFDGVRFTVYNTANSPGLTTNRLLGLRETSDGSLLIISEQYRLLRFRDGRFTQLAADGVGDVQTTIEGTAGRVWVAAGTCRERGWYVARLRRHRRVAQPPRGGQGPLARAGSEQPATPATRVAQASLRPFIESPAPKVGRGRKMTTDATKPAHTSGRSRKR
jgi:hypothetical protein